MLNVCIDSIQNRFFHNTLSSLEVLQIVLLVHTKTWKGGGKKPNKLETLWLEE